METQEREAKQRELTELKSRVAQLEKELASGGPQWQLKGYYTAYYATAGAFLGMFGAIVSLLFNVLGSLATNQHPLRLIQVYLTFPLGERALLPDMESGLGLAIGCCLYVATGMLLGIFLFLAITRVTKASPQVSLGLRLGLATVFGLGIWVINFYGILSWLQPALLDGNWIVETIPWWVAALTHLVFAWTIALLYPLGLYKPYRLQTEV